MRSRVSTGDGNRVPLSHFNCDTDSARLRPNPKLPTRLNLFPRGRRFSFLRVIQLCELCVRRRGEKQLSAVRVCHIVAGSTAGKGSYLWDGAAGTWFWIDPTNDLVFLGMVQRMMTAPGMPNLEDLSRALVYQALVDTGK